MHQIPRLLIAGTHSGVGKTTIATGIMAALTRRGYNLQPYKVGPDYIDPGYHTLVTGNISRNLDTWLTSEEAVKRLFVKSAVGKDIAIIEGVMGLFDGGQASSAHIAKLTQTPVILVIDVKSMAESAAAIAYGFQNLDPEVRIAGLILNKIGSISHYRMVKEAIEDRTGLPVIGYLLKDQKIQMPERHLGLVTTSEGENLQELIALMVEKVEVDIDINKLITLANDAPPITISPTANDPLENIYGSNCGGYSAKKLVRIGIAKDKAFTFYYQDSLELLEALGAELVPFSPVVDTKLPEGLDGLIIGGGYPETFLQALANNYEFISDLKAKAAKGMPIYAECGGQMYLSKEIVDFDGKSYPMAGLVPGKSKMQKKLVAMGYVTVTANKDNILMAAGESCKGHEFHYSSLEIDNGNEDILAFQLTKKRDGSQRKEGYNLGNILTSYLHLHFEGNTTLAKNFISKCREYQKWRTEHDH